MKLVFWTIIGSMWFAFCAWLTCKLWEFGIELPDYLAAYREREYFRNGLRRDT